MGTFFFLLQSKAARQTVRLRGMNRENKADKGFAAAAPTCRPFQEHMLQARDYFKFYIQGPVWSTMSCHI